MSDLYEYMNGEHYNVFWHEGEFYLHDRRWYMKGRKPECEFAYFDTTDDCLKAMLKIAPYRDWKKVDLI
jgi:hypothetical protein